MARIAGVDLPRNKRGIIGLTYIYGVGSTRSAELLDRAEIEHNTKVQDWTDENIKFITKLLQDEYTVEGELRSEVQLTFKTSDGYWMLQRYSSQKGSSFKRSAY